MKLPRWLRWRSDAELDEELRAHLEAEVEAGLARGLSLDDARFAARRALGNAARIKERAREADPLAGLHAIVKDARYALRGLRRAPGFTFAAVLSLALGIGANTAIFSLMDSILLRPLDVPRPSELVSVTAVSSQSRFHGLSYPEYTAYRDRNGSLAGLVAKSEVPLSLKSAQGDLARVAFGQLVSGNFFEVLGAELTMGRGFTPADDAPGAPGLAAVLSYSGWVGRFAGDPSVVGRVITVNGQPATVVGVLDRRFTGTNLVDRPEIYLPVRASGVLLPTYDPPLLDVRRQGQFSVYGRRNAGASIERVQADLAVISRGLQEQYPETNRNRSVVVLNEMDARLERESEVAVLAYLLLGLAATVLLIACANVANLLLGRASARAREIAIRMSVGAGRRRLVAQLLTESAVLASLGCVAGLLLASAAMHYFSSVQFPSDFPIEIATRLDTRVLAYTLGAMAVSVLWFGLWPALRATRADLTAAAQSARPQRNIGRNLLVGAQTALAATLLVAAGLFVQSFIAFTRADPGFRIDGILVAAFDPAAAGYTEAQARDFYDRLHRRVKELGGVRSAALVSHVQLSLNGPGRMRVGREDAQDPRADYVTAAFNRVTPDYFETTATAIVRGRTLDDRDIENRPQVAVVNETLARRLWPEADPIGRRLRLGGAGERFLEVVGVARDAKYDSLTEPPAPYLFLPFAQAFEFRMSALIHSAADPASLAGVLRAEVQALGADVPMYDLRTMRDTYEGVALVFPRVEAQLIGTMGLIGLALAVVGLYAVVAFVVGRRTREIGIRMALGASPRATLREVLVLGLKIALAGVAVGLAGALTLTGYFANMLGTLNPRDPATFLGVAGLLVAVAMAACWAPARRASRVDPAITLREEA